MNRYEDDDLDRLLFSLPLEEPPEGMRASILAGTVYRPAFPVKAWEVTVIGVLLAICAWLTILIVRGGAPAFVETLAVFGNAFSHVVMAQNTWFWVCTGGGVAFVLHILNLVSIPPAAPHRFSRR